MEVDQNLTAWIHCLGELFSFFPNFGVPRRVVITGGDDRKNERKEEERIESWKGWTGIRETRELSEMRGPLTKTGEVHVSRGFVFR